MNLYNSFTFAIVCIFALLVYALVDDIRKVKRNMSRSKQQLADVKEAVQTLRKDICTHDSSISCTLCDAHMLDLPDMCTQHGICPVCEINHLPDNIVYCCDKCAACQDDWSVVVDEYERDIRSELCSLQQFMNDMNISTVITRNGVHLYTRNTRISFDAVRALHNRGTNAKCIERTMQNSKGVKVYKVKGLWLTTGSHFHAVVDTKRKPVTISRKQWSDAVINMQLELI
jgi:hypothetical protein